jgi:hypothetical protein
MTYIMKAIPPMKFLAEFCGEYIRDHVCETLVPNPQFKITPEQMENVKENSRPESYLLAAFVMDWYAIRDEGNPPYFFKSGKWFWYPERRLAIPAEALPGLLFAGKPGDLDFEYVHSDWNDPERTNYVGKLDPEESAKGRLRQQIKPLLQFGMDFDKAIWKLAQAQYPVHIFNQAKEEMWCLDLWFSYSTYKKLSKGSKALDGKVIV